MKFKEQTIVTGDMSEEEVEHSYLNTLMYGRYAKDLSEAAREEARRLRRLRKRRLKDDRERKKELQHGYKPTGKISKAFGYLWSCSFARLGEDWVFLAVLGVIMAVLNFVMDQGVGLCNNARVWMYRDLATSYVTQYLAWVSLPTILILFSAGFVHLVAPQSIGSGIPEMKTILRGVHLKEYLSARTLVAKVVGLTATLGSGMPLGKEGPSVHIASMVATLLSKLVTSFQGIYANESRTSEMLAAACAVGVAACFASPVGGVLFSIEVTTTYFAVRNYWRGFFAACCGATVFRLLSVWSGATATVKPLFPTHFEMEFPFDPFELIIFLIIGIIAGLMGAVYVWLHRQYVLFMRNSKRLTQFLQKNRFIYPGVVTLCIASITFPLGLGRYMGGPMGNQEQVLSMFANFTWTENLTAEEAVVIQHWTPPGVSPFLTLTGFILSTFLLSIVASTLPVPSGIFIPSFKMGAALGRLVGELVHLWCPKGVSFGGHLQPILPGGYACVGAAAVAGAVTHTVSTVVIMFEMTGQVTHIVPCMIAVLTANAVAALLQPSCFDSIIMIKKLPYLPDLLSSASRMYDICVEDFMVRDVKYIWDRMTFQELKDTLKDNKAIRSFPLVNSPSNMVLLGSIQRWELVQLIDAQVGRERRLQVAALWKQEAEAMKRKQEEAKKKELEQQPKQRRPSRFEVSPAPDILALQSGMTRGTSLTNNDQTGLASPAIPAPGQLFRPKSILKKTNSFTMMRGGSTPATPTTPHPSVYTTVTGAESRIRMAFEAIFKKSTTLQDVESGGGGGDSGEGSESAALTPEYTPVMTPVRSPSINKKVQLPRERVCDMSPEDQRLWEREEMARPVHFDTMLARARLRADNEEVQNEVDEDHQYLCHIDPAPFQLVERTSLLKVHSLFSTLGVSRAYVTAIGRLIGVVALAELRKAIENANSGNPPARPAAVTVAAAPPSDCENAPLTKIQDSTT